jgi:DNA invertase Pin-like site-specific DNA recombinase
LQVLQVIKECSDKGVAIHIVKSNMIVDSSIQSKALVLIYGLVAEMERDFISVRTKESLARKKSEGFKLGRPEGSTNKILKLDDHREKILNLLDNKVTLVDIAKLVNVSRATIYGWIKKNNIPLKKDAKKLTKKF